MTCSGKGILPRTNDTLVFAKSPKAAVEKLLPASAVRSFSEKPEKVSNR